MENEKQTLLIKELSMSFREYLEAKNLITSSVLEETTIAKDPKNIEESFKTEQDDVVKDSDVNAEAVSEVLENTVDVD
jgi:hypothetical protein